MSPEPVPGPSISPLVEAASAGAAPWWGVPVVAGTFLLLGGFLTFLFARSNEDRKADRERRTMWDADVLERGVELLMAGERMRDLGLMTLPRGATEAAIIVAKRGMATVEVVNTAARRFMLVMPGSLEATFKAYMSWTMLLVVPPFQREGQLHALDEQLNASRELVTALRALRSLPPLNGGTVDHSWMPETVNRSLATLRDEMTREEGERDIRDGGTETSQDGTGAS